MFDTSTSLRVLAASTTTVPRNSPAAVPAIADAVSDAKRIVDRVEKSFQPLPHRLVVSPRQSGADPKSGLLRAWAGVKELALLAANHNAFAAYFILNTRRHNERNVGIDVKIAVCTDALAGIVVLCPANGHRHGGCMASVLRIPDHGRGAIKNLVQHYVMASVSIPKSARPLPAGKLANWLCLRSGKAYDAQARGPINNLIDGGSHD